MSEAGETYEAVRSGIGVARGASGERVTGHGVPSLFPGRQWQQVLARDAKADGQFVYAVKSTGIYCRPSCPSRRPARKNVSFFATAGAAEAAGFRACKRCEPERAEARPDPQAAMIAAATEYLSEHAGERTRLEDLAKVTGAGRLAVLRGFKRVLGVSPGEFAKAQRVARFKDALRPRSVKTNAKRLRMQFMRRGLGRRAGCMRAAARRWG
jgi:AraC family transcriptional regulator of adaptative response/methylated-DNA-[protein]-cysteine methyltransferase